MLVESDGMMGVLPEGGEVMGVRLPGMQRGDSVERYVEDMTMVEEEPGET